MDPLGTDSCRGTVPMEPLMPNGSMQHQEPKSEIDDTRIILQGASCTIAARAWPDRTPSERSRVHVQPRKIFLRKNGILYFLKFILNLVSDPARGARRPVHRPGAGAGAG